MSFIVPTERKHWRTRLLIGAMYVVVAVGALTMVYPFLIMISGSLKDRVDFDRFEVIPSYLTDDTLLFKKYERARYLANMWRYQIAAKSELEIMDDIPVPDPGKGRAAADLEEFLATANLPGPFLALGQTGEQGVQPRILRQFRQALYREFDGELAAFNRAMGATFKSWDEITVPELHAFGRGNVAGDTVIEKFHREQFRSKVPLHEFWPIHIEGVFFTDLRGKFGRDLASLNAAWGTDFAWFQDVPLPRTHPGSKPWAGAWEEFVRRVIHENFLRLTPEAVDAFRAFAKSRGAGTEFSERCPPHGRARKDWLAFIEHGDCLSFIEIDSVEFRFRDFLASKYGSLDTVNAAHGASYNSFESIPLNFPQYDLHLMTKHRREIVWEFFTRNYRHAADYLLLRGRAFWNTVIYCAGNVLLHLIVNPLAAYALSRHRLRWSHLILLFCMLTMAIPAEVGSIPRFLLIRELGLLNTFWALILPGAAHGFSIFILKGFFDGLPQDLYEAAQIEGAPERWMFWHVTLALTKPILAVTALGAFTSAYGAFLFALIICPDQKMWTISVWLYQFQQHVTEAVGFAALVLASIPVLVVFLFAQRVILRGIVLPVEK